MTGAALLLLALTLVVAAGNWLAVERDLLWLEYVCKPLTMVLLLLACLALDVDSDAARAWFLVALAFCLAGDVFLMLPQDLFVPGLASFLVGHVAYIGGMLALDVTAPRLLVGGVLVTVAVLTVGGRVLRGVRRVERALAGPVLAYILVISAMVATAVGTGRVLAVLGAVSFYVSDSLIAWNRFLASTPHARLSVMVTYHLGQIGLVLALT